MRGSGEKGKWRPTCVGFLLPSPPWPRGRERSGAVNGEGGGKWTMVGIHEPNWETKKEEGRTPIGRQDSTREE